ncbi:hypothetical protein [Pseudovibrio sp. Ad37]|uniref:hypothetical protein n=1 Tax=Pseudovibrio sp. Ad37 TaxID=989422 RepID=UPI0007AE75A7|nr:hypothetical protein [Pseudovibrio sp. Ad37]KZL24241.1 hypothetical protein PsAD37_02812 [Pseudovibrio sp. Ad37]
MIISVDANAPGYWESVRKNATQRRAFEAIKKGLKTIRISQVYEQYVEDHLYLIQEVARKEGLHKDLDQYKQFRCECADTMGLPELTDCDESDIHQFSLEAVLEAAEALYGDEGGLGRSQEQCSCCGELATCHRWEKVEGGSITFYTSIYCEHCGRDEFDS